MTWEFAIAVLLGNGLLTAFLIERYKRTQEEKLSRVRSDLEGEIRHLQAGLDRAVNVHRVQFDTEFEALKNLWTKVADARAAMGMVRPIFDIIPANETPEQQETRELERLRGFHSAVQDLSRSIHTVSPFIPKSLVDTFQSVVRIARQELTEVRTEIHARDRGGSPMEWYERGRAHFEELSTLADSASDLIRDRLATLTELMGEKRGTS